MKINKTPDWVTKGKTIRQLIEELKTFEDQDIEARISLDGGETDYCISILGRHHEVCAEKLKYRCVIMNAENIDED